jgi:hypothetical protein
MPVAWLADKRLRERRLEKLPQRPAGQKELGIWILGTLPCNPKLTREKVGFFRGGLG